MENHTAKHFVLQLGSLASLYLSLSFLLVLTFGLINIVFPNAADSLWEVENANGMVRIGFAMTVVFFPTYLVLTRLVNKSRRKQPDGSYLGLTKWLIYLSLLVGGAVLLGDLVAVIIAFLEGDLTQRFLLKALAVLLVVGAAFSYYLLDAKGRWITHEKQSVQYGLIASTVVLILLVAGITSIDSPAKFREFRLDEKQVTDLQNIQWHVQEYLALEGALPESLADLPSSKLPSAPETRSPYTYEVTAKGFQLCATFSADSETKDYYYYDRPVPVDVIRPTVINPDNWQYEAGDWCFERVVKTNE